MEAFTEHIHGPILGTRSMDTNTSPCWGQNEDIGRGRVRRRKDSHYTITENEAPSLLVYLRHRSVTLCPDLLTHKVMTYYYTGCCFGAISVYYVKFLKI